MATGTLGTQARQFDWQATHYLRKKINYNDANIGTADKVAVGIIPNNGLIVGVYVRIETAFNAARATRSRSEPIPAPTTTSSTRRTSMRRRWRPPR